MDSVNILKTTDNNFEDFLTIRWDLREDDIEYIEMKEEVEQLGISAENLPEKLQQLVYQYVCEYVVYLNEEMEALTTGETYKHDLLQNFLATVKNSKDFFEKILDK